MLCENILFLRLLNYFNIIVSVLRFLIPIFLIIKLTLDLYKGIINPNDDNIKNVIIKRIFAAVIIFFIPTLVNILLGFMEGITGMSFNYSECMVNIKNISYYEEKKELERKLKESKYSQEILVKYNEYMKQLEEEIKRKSNSGVVGGIVVGQRYNLSESELRGLCGVAKAEQGSINGARAEATLIANRYELLNTTNAFYGKGLYNYVRNSGWFAHAANHMSEGCPSDYLQAVRDVLVNGNRTMPLYIDEHDCFDCNKSRYCSNKNNGDICKLENNGQTYSSMDIIKSRNNQYYISGVTKIYTVYKESSSIKYWTFYTFVKNEDGTNKGDPFGYTNGAKEKIDSMNK